MYRMLMDKLIEWKENPDKKPLILQGVRQCGKTYLLKEFGSRCYDDVAYYNFDDDPGVDDYFAQNLKPHRIVEEMSVKRGRTIKPGKTLIIFDEVQISGKALRSLKYFCEDAPEYHVIAAGSLLGVAISKDYSFPVGKVQFLTLRPMNFKEFLIAGGNTSWCERIESGQNYSFLKADLENLYRQFLFVGGMPKVVQSWLDTKEVEKVDEIQKEIIMSYENDFAKYAPISYFPKLSAIWNAIPSQLAKENRKFIFSQVKKSWRAKDLEDALEWLLRAGLVYKVENIEKPYFPLSAYANHTYFKLYMSDTGLLRRTANLPASVLFDKTDNYKEFKGAMAENFVCCELKKIYDENIYYWTAEGAGKAEVDFIVQADADIIPIEVKAGTASRARSLGEYRKKFNPAKSVLTSLDHDKEHILPLYAFWNFRNWVKMSHADDNE